MENKENVMITNLKKCHQFLLQKTVTKGGEIVVTKSRKPKSQ
jgi:hypothetical protein